MLLMPWEFAFIKSAGPVIPMGLANNTISIRMFFVS
jgi:hypothetical protein